tara:strand:- start:3410 stop:3697 length:288 start_codon:yes stop_codon:yes gene_type:complete
MVLVFLNGVDKGEITSDLDATVRNVLDELKIKYPKTTDDISLIDGYILDGNRVRIWTEMKVYRHKDAAIFYMGIRARINTVGINDIHIETDSYAV